MYAKEEEPLVVQRELVWSEEGIKRKIDNTATQYGVSADTMHKVIKCESNYDRYALGDNGKSRGLVQIHSDYHDVSDEDAYDPEYAIEFLAKKLKEGKGHLWTCYRKLP